MWQNMQSENSSEELLRLLRPRFVFNGHDHHGCSVVHYKNGSVVSIQLPLIIDDSIDIQQTTFEITVRSIMAEFHGSIGLFEIHRHRENHYSVHSCEFYHHLTVWVGLIIGLLILLLAALYDLLGWYGEIIKRRPRRSARLKRA
jgi:hypothetical protein